MKTLLLSLCLSLGVLGWTQSKPQTQTWEYKVEFNVKEKKLNELGTQGWELVAIGNTVTGSVSVDEYIFKRSR